MGNISFCRLVSILTKKLCIAPVRTSSITSIIFEDVEVSLEAIFNFFLRFTGNACAKKSGPFFTSNSEFDDIFFSVPNLIEEVSCDEKSYS